MAPSLIEPLLASCDAESSAPPENGVSCPPVLPLNRPISKVDIVESFETGVSSSLQSDLQTVINTLNLYVGVGILSLGYAVKVGGWASLGLLAVLSALLCYSAQLIGRSFDRVPPNLVPSYLNLGHTVFGRPGQYAVMLMGGAEFFGGLCVCLIVIWQSITMLLPAYPICLRGYCMIPIEVAVLGSTLFLVPAVLIRTFSRLTSISISGVISSLMLTSGMFRLSFVLYFALLLIFSRGSSMFRCGRVVVIMAYAVDPQQKDVTDPAALEHDVVDWTHLPMAAGIMIVSMSGHAGVPSLRRSMKNPGNFERCIRIAFICIFVIYASIGGFAYLYFGKSTQVLVTQNLSDSSSVTGFILVKIGSFSISMNQLVIVLVAMSAYTTCPALVYVLAEVIVDLLRGDSATHLPGAGDLVARTLVLGAAYIVAIVAYDVLDSVESILGGVFSISVSLLFPTLFYYMLYREELSSIKKTTLLIIILLSCVTVLGVGGMNIWQLAQKESRVGH